MENASEALIMAGTILISLIIISALILMFTGVIKFNKNDESNIEFQQMADFNKEYTSFEKNLYGSELLSLINKAVDYNTKHTSEDGFTPITISFKIGKGTGNNTSSSLVQSGKTYSITLKESNTELLIRMEEIKELYNGDQYLQKLITLNNKDQTAEMQELLHKINASFTVTKSREHIKKYEEYIEFKRKKFRFIKTISDGEIQSGSKKKDTKGRIVKMEFEEITK